MKVKTKHPFIGTFFDLDKAFDSIDPDFLLYCFLKRGIRKRIISLIDDLLETKVSVKVNHSRGISFNPSIGVLQGGGGVFHHLFYSSLF